jgi:hypothetical protein
MVRSGSVPCGNCLRLDVETLEAIKMKWSIVFAQVVLVLMCCGCGHRNVSAGCTDDGTHVDLPCTTDMPNGGPVHIRVDVGNCVVGLQRNVTVAVPASILPLNHVKSLLKSCGCLSAHASADGNNTLLHIGYTSKPALDTDEEVVAVKDEDNKFVADITLDAKPVPEISLAPSSVAFKYDSSSLSHVDRVTVSSNNSGTYVARIVSAPDWIQVIAFGQPHSGFTSLSVGLSDHKDFGELSGVVVMETNTGHSLSLPVVYEVSGPVKLSSDQFVEQSSNKYCVDLNFGHAGKIPQQEFHDVPTGTTIKTVRLSASQESLELNISPKKAGGFYSGTIRVSFAGQKTVLYIPYVFFWTPSLD